MCAILILREQLYEVKSGQSLNQALVTLDIDPGSVLAIREGAQMKGDNLIMPGDHIRLIHVIAGG